jgi:hypothetical protein
MQANRYDMGQKPNLNGKYGRKGLRALLIALTMLVVVTAGAATAESSYDAQTLENELMTLEAAQEIETNYLISDSLLMDRDVYDNLSTDDLDHIDDGGTVVVFVWTNGETAIVVVVIFQDDGSYEVTHIARMSVEDARERLADFDGRIIVRHFGNSGADPICPHGYLAARWSVDQTTDSASIGQFKGVWMTDESVVGGNITGKFANGLFRGMATNLDGEVIGTLQGGYGNGLYRGVWELSDGSASGVLAGKYRATDAGQGVMKGKWKQNCNGAGIEPVPVDPTHIKCKRMATDVASTDESTDVDMSRCKVKPLPIDVDVKPMKKPLQIDPTDVKEDDSGLDSVKKGAQDLLETELVEMDGGLTIDVGDAAAGGVISSLPMIGLGLLRRRFLLI